MLTKAKRQSKVPPNLMPAHIWNAICDLKTARERLRKAGCKNAADYVQRALKSAEGALRHAQRMDMQEYLAAQQGGGGDGA